MHRLWYLAVTTVIFVGASSAAIAQTPSKAFKNCTELRKVYPKGVAKSTKAAGKTGATVKEINSHSLVRYTIYRYLMGAMP